MTNVNGTHDENITQSASNPGNSSTSRRFAERLHSGVDRAAEKGEELERRLQEGRVNLDVEARRMSSKAVRMVRENPWMALGGSIAVGFLLGALSRRN